MICLRLKKAWLFDQMEFEDIKKVLRIQELSFPGMDPWKEDHLHSHLTIFPGGQLIAELDGEIIGSCSSLDH